MSTLVACAGPGGGTTPPVLSGPASLIAWFPVTGSEGTFLTEQTREFQATNEKVKVTIEPSPDVEKVQAAVVAGTPADIRRDSYLTMLRWVDQNALEPIDAYLDKRGKDDYYDYARDGSTLGGKMYQWPWLFSPTGLVVNRQLLREKNADNLLPAPGPKAEWTFDQWKAALTAGTTRSADPETAVYGTVFATGQTGVDYQTLMYLWSNGADLYDRDETKVTICSPAGTQALQMVVDLIHRDRVALPGAEKMMQAQATQLLFSKKIAVLNGTLREPADAKTMLQQGTLLPPADFVFVPTPHAPGKPSSAFVGIPGFFVFKQPSNKDRTIAAMQFGAFLTDTPAQKAVRPTGLLPVRKSAGNIYADDPNNTTALASVQNGRSMGRFPESGEIRNVILPELQAAVAGQKTPKDALDEICRLSEPIMAKRRR